MRRLAAGQTPHPFMASAAPTDVNHPHVHSLCWAASCTAAGSRRARPCRPAAAGGRAVAQAPAPARRASCTARAGQKASSGSAALLAVPRTHAEARNPALTEGTVAAPLAGPSSAALLRSSCRSAWRRMVGKTGRCCRLLREWGESGAEQQGRGSAPASPQATEIAREEAVRGRGPLERALESPARCPPSGLRKTGRWQRS